jgi:hypothetical protein
VCCGGCFTCCLGTPGVLLLIGFAVGCAMMPAVKQEYEDNVLPYYPGTDEFKVGYSAGLAALG